MLNIEPLFFKDVDDAVLRNNDDGVIQLFNAVDDFDFTLEKTAVGFFGVFKADVGAELCASQAGVFRLFFWPDSNELLIAGLTSCDRVGVDCLEGDPKRLTFGVTVREFILNRVLSARATYHFIALDDVILFQFLGITNQSFYHKCNLHRINIFLSRILHTQKGVDETNCQNKDDLKMFPLSPSERACCGGRYRPLRSL